MLSVKGSAIVRGLISKSENNAMCLLCSQDHPPIALPESTHFRKIHLYSVRGFGHSTLDGDDPALFDKAFRK
jgi:hypothetical protein